MGSNSQYIQCLRVALQVPVKDLKFACVLLSQESGVYNKVSFCPALSQAHLESASSFDSEACDDS